ncbi:MAG: M23 family metallopeptidase [Propionibacteriaceae bacterium]|nr:M23 family metallopeptidase [Propionibacteriaceae bacterium]
MRKLAPWRRLVAVSCAVAIAFGGSVVSAQADDLKAEKAKADAAVSQAQANVDLSSYNLKVANDRVAAAQTKVADAQAELTSAQDAVAAAQAVQAQKAQELDQADKDLAQAQADEAAGQAQVDAQHDAIGNYARSLVQDSFPLISVAALINSSSTASLSNRIQWTDTVLTTNQVDLDNLRVLQAQLAAARQASQQAQEKADAARQAAEEQVAATQSAQDAAARARDDVQAALDEENAAQGAAAQALAADQQMLAETQAEAADVNARIAEAARVAEEQRKAEEARKAAEAAANQGNGGGSQGSQTSSSGLIWTVKGPITDYYGYRIHPIFGDWRFHDGLDIGVGCGTPVRAAASGRVTDEYYGGGYGYRLFIDHGYVNGHYMVTSYNHLSGYAVPAGTWVTQGQTVAYIGSTGNSTGCHMHFMLWVDGTAVNPLPYLP